MKLGHRHGADKDERAAEQHEAADHGDGKRHLPHHVADRFEDLVKIDDRHVREPLHQVVLESRSRRRIARTAQRRHERLRRLVERPRPEDEHEAAIA